MTGVCLIALALPSCLDRNEMFMGTWVSAEAIPDGHFITGRPELALGHYGLELTGVARFLDAEGLPVTSCPCAFVEQQDVDLEARTFRAATTRCDGSTWIWQLTLIEDDTGLFSLAGEVAPASGGTAPVSVHLEQVDDFVSDDLKECAR